MATIELNPRRGAEIFVPNFKAIVNNNVVELSGEGQGVSTGPSGFRFSVDLEDETYITHKLSATELNEVLTPKTRSVVTPTPTCETSPTSKRIQENSPHVIQVSLVVLTEDPVLIDLARTSVRAQWAADSSSGDVYLIEGLKSWWANPKTVLSTEWFVESINQTQNPPGQTGGQIYVTAWGSYINWNWLDNDLPTWSSHMASLLLRPDDLWTYSWYANHGGESSKLLNGKIAIDINSNFQP